MLCQVQTPLLSVELQDEGPPDGPPVLLLHGWPDDASTWRAVSDRLNAAGLRTLTPSLRGFGATRFLSDATARTGNSGVLALDAIDLLDALGLDAVDVAGHDWGSNTAEAMAVGWPGRVRRMAMLSTPSRIGGMPTPPFSQVRRQWYHWFQATARGADAVRADPVGFGRIMWDTWSPAGWYDERTFTEVARSWDNPDFVDVTLHSYRARWGEADPDPRSADLEAQISGTQAIDTPTLYVQGAVDGVNPPSASEDVASSFSGPFRKVELDGVGHFPTRESPDEVARLLLEHLGHGAAP